MRVCRSIFAYFLLLFARDTCVCEFAPCICLLSAIFMLKILSFLRPDHPITRSETYSTYASSFTVAFSHFVFVTCHQNANEINYYYHYYRHYIIYYIILYYFVLFERFDSIFHFCFFQDKRENNAWNYLQNQKGNE